MNLKLLRKGMDFRADERPHLDLRNHRYYIEFVDKDGLEVCGSVGKTYIYRTHHLKDKRKKLATPVMITDEALHLDLQYNNEDGYTYRYKGEETHELIKKEGLMFTQQDLLDIVNYYSKDHYTGIEII